MEGKIIGLFLIALIGGLTGGFGLSYIIYQPQVQNLQNTTSNLQNTTSNLQDQVANLNSTLQGLLNMSGAGVSNQVQVSGTVSITQTGTIEFTSLNGTIKSSVPIANGKYSILLVGGQSYNVRVENERGYYAGDYSLYVPLSVATFTANF